MSNSKDGDIVGLDSDGCLMIWFEGEEGEEVFAWDAGPGAVATMVRGMLGVEDV